jgi:para-nitrobenzyl esterase
MAGSRAASFGLVVMVTVSLLAQSAPPAMQRVLTQGGLVEGVSADGLAIFQGIPFAAPPVGDLRWRAPQPVVPWGGVRKADAFSPICPQLRSYPEDAPVEPQSEDCLYLNVWKPITAPTSRLPVMVWIHGGGLQSGSGSIPLYAGDQLARRGVIVVTANYRLGVLGFLAHPDLTRESGHDASGNYGLQDQLAAIRWVKQNIGAFGGDSDRVTVFGQSSGAISISALVASPLARGLFQRAIGQSGGLFEPMRMLPIFALPGAERSGVEFVSRAGVSSIRELRALPVDKLLPLSFTTTAIVDGHVLTRPPYDTFVDGQQNDTPVLLGSNRDEGEYFLRGRTITRANLRQEIARSFPPVILNAMGVREATDDADAHAAAGVFNRDIRFRWDMWAWARLSTRHGVPAYAYEFARQPPAGSIYAGLGATHGTEMSYVFGHLDPPTLPWTAADRRLADAITTYWTNFAKNGNPNGRGVPPWPVFDESKAQGLLLGDEIRVGQPFDAPAMAHIDAAYASVRASVANSR